MVCDAVLSIPNSKFDFSSVFFFCFHFSLHSMLECLHLNLNWRDAHLANRGATFFPVLHETFSPAKPLNFETKKWKKNTRKKEKSISYRRWKWKCEKCKIKVLTPFVGRKHTARTLPVPVNRWFFVVQVYWDRYEIFLLFFFLFVWRNTWYAIGIYLNQL